METKQQDPRRAVQKDAWTTPRLVTLQAGEAEGGPNPVVFEGAFARGS